MKPTNKAIQDGAAIACGFNKTELITLKKVYFELLS